MFIFCCYNTGTPETDLYIEYSINNTLRMQSVNMNKVCYLIFENETFLGGAPSNDNDIFELVHVSENIVAFRVVNRNLGNSSEAVNETAQADSELGETGMQINSESESDEMDTIQTESDESGEQSSDCYLGFADTTSEPRCYASIEFAATRFVIIH